MADMKRAFVTGWPVDHSRSPILHSHWLTQAGLEGEYVKRPCSERDFPAFLSNFSDEGFIGGNVTLPLKEKAFELAQKLSPAARRLGAVNTLWLEDGVLNGDNTDGYGFLANLNDSAPGWDDPDHLTQGALVLGAGGAARAIVDSLVQRGFSPVYIANRTVERAQALAEKFGASCKAIDRNDAMQLHSVAIIINTTSIGMNDGQSPIDLSDFDRNVVVSDIVYTPLQTPLLKQADELGMMSVDGLGMLLNQAVPGFERWFGIRPKVTLELRNLILADLGELV